MVTSVCAEESSVNSTAQIRNGLLSDAPDDPGNLLPLIQERGSQKEAIFRSSPLVGLHDAIDRAKQDLYDKTHIKVGMSIAHLSQWLSESAPGEDSQGMATVMDLPATWEAVNRGEENQGQVFFHVQGRWNYGTTGPENLGPVSLGSLSGTANTYSAYTPAFIVRNLYWQQGSEAAGWAYRIGRITPDSMLGTSAHLNPQTTFLSTTAIGSFAAAHADSGLGGAVAFYFNDRFKVMGLVSNANGNRYDYDDGDVDEGDFYKALEFAFKIAPRTEKAGYSKLTLWHTDGTQDGQASNGMTGPDGWGFFLKHEQELTDDGDVVVVLKYGKSFNDSAFYEQQAGAHCLFYNPTGVTRLTNDLIGVGCTWAQATESTARSETNAEVFYRFPIFPLVDMTVSYQSVFNPALDHDNDHASAFSLRIRTTF